MIDLIIFRFPYRDDDYTVDVLLILVFVFPPPILYVGQTVLSVYLSADYTIFWLDVLNLFFTLDTYTRLPTYVESLNSHTYLYCVYLNYSFYNNYSSVFLSYMMTVDLDSRNNGVNNSIIAVIQL